MPEDSVEIRRLASGVPGLDRVLGGGLPEYSFNLIAGAPGTGKTTLSQQIMYANATAERSVLHFTVLGEPPLKLLRYQQQFAFFDPATVGRFIQYRNLSEEVLAGDLRGVLDAIVQEVERADPQIVVVDSFRTLVSTQAGPGGALDVQSFLQQLSIHLAGWETTSFLIGEYMESEMRDNPVFTVADSILWLHQVVERNSAVRKVQVVKLRGQAPMPGLHTFRITESGLRIFPRTELQPARGPANRPQGRLATGVDGLDAMVGGGIPAGDAIMLAGPAGSGKTTFGGQFIAEGGRTGERCVIAIFEENPESYIRRAAGVGAALSAMIERGDLRIIYLRPLDLSVDEALQEIHQAVADLGAARLVIDSLTGFEVALAQNFRNDFHESLYRMLAGLATAGVTTLMTVEVTDDYTSLRFSPHAISFLTDHLILQRYVEIDGQLRRVLAVVKMRGSEHAHDWREYEVTSEGLALRGALHQYRGIISGVPVPRDEQTASHPGLTGEEVRALGVLEERQQATGPDIATTLAVSAAHSERVLERLVLLNYALADAQDGQRVYRPAARSLKA